jgi:hypothetical protein
VHQPGERLRPSPDAEGVQGVTDVVYAGRPFDATPAVRSNPAAIAGAALSMVPVVGVILSVLGLLRTQTLGGAGRTVATVGLALSVAFTAGEAFAAYEIADSTASADPACVATRADVDALQIRLSTDVATLANGGAQVPATAATTTAAATTGDATSAASAATALVTDLRSVKSALEHNIGRATHANVRIGLQAFDADLGTLISSVRQVESGDQAAIALIQVTVAKLRADGQSIDVVCDGAPT